MTPFAVESRSFHQNAQKLTDSMKISNIVWNILWLAADKGTSWKASVLATFSRLSWQKKSLQRANVTELTENISTQRISDRVVRLDCSLSY